MKDGSLVLKRRWGNVAVIVQCRAISPNKKLMRYEFMRISLLQTACLIICACGVWLVATVQLNAAEVQPSLKPFATDGCSMWLDGTPANRYAWRHCCVAHDKDYWLGGTAEQRKFSDETLRACVTQAGGRAMAEYLYLNVRWGGAPTWLTPYRWGYGWDYVDSGKPRGYKIPAELEQQQIALRLPEAEQLIKDDAIKHSALINSEKK